MRASSLLAVSLSSLVLLLSAHKARAASPLHVDGPWFRDDSGRVVILRGINATGSSKVPPFTGAHDPSIYQPLQEWGLNTVRMLFTWEAYEPQEGALDSAYLEGAAAAVNAAWEAGQYVIVDFHQDAFSRYSIDGCGDGFPLWALPPSVVPDEPDNGPLCSNWGIKMQGDTDMLAAWTAFYSDEYGVRTKYLSMLEKVSERLSTEPGVIGYDIINEPWGDEVTEIGPFYEDAAVAIRKASPDAIIFVSPRALTSAGTDTALEKPTFGNMAYSPHFYDGGVVLFESWSGVEPEDAFENMKSRAKSWDVPLFLGEFGAPGPTEEGPAYIDMLYRRLNEDHFSGAQWSYTPAWNETTKDGWNDEDFSIVDGKGQLRDNFRKRPSPRKIAGTPLVFRVNDADSPEDRSVEFEWTHDPALGETELYLPTEDFFGADEIDIETTPQSLSCKTTGTHVTCSSSTSGEMRAVFKKAAPSPPPDSGGCSIEEQTPKGGMTAALLSIMAVLFAFRRRPRAGASQRGRTDTASS